MSKCKSQTGHSTGPRKSFCSISSRYTSVTLNSGETRKTGSSRFANYTRFTYVENVFLLCTMEVTNNNVYSFTRCKVSKPKNDLNMHF